MRRSTMVLGLVLLATHAEAGLFGGNDAPGRIPVPAREFGATVLDEAGVTVRVSKLTMDGEVFLYGELGKAQVTVPFEEVARATFVDVDVDHTKAIIETRSGEQVEVVMDADRPVFGRTSYGNYRVEVQDIDTLTLGG